MGTKARIDKLLTTLQQSVRFAATGAYLMFCSICKSDHPVRETFQMIALTIEFLIPIYKLFPSKSDTSEASPGDGLTDEERAARNELQRLYSEARSTKDPEKALQNYSRLIELKPGSYFGERAMFFSEQGDDELALADYDKAVEHNPALWLKYRACFWGLRGDLERSVGDYQRLIDLKSAPVANTAEDSPKEYTDNWNLAEVYWLRAEMYELHKDLQLALADQQKAAQVSRDFIARYADFCERNGFWEPYLLALNELVNLRWPHNHLLRRAKFYMTEGEFGKAKTDFDKAVKVSPRFGVKSISYSPRGWALKQRAEFFLQQDKTKEANRDLKRAERLSLLQDFLFGFHSWPVEYRTPRIFSEEGLKTKKES
jgi:tetratricopeptide (TPR) repeat protein